MYTREIRRQNRVMPEEETLALLKQGEFGVMATVAPDGMPYGVPLSYVYENGVLSFHCAREGYKLENIAANNKVSFTVVDSVQAVYDGSFSTYYRSAVVFGTVEEVTDPKERYRILYALAQKYLPGHMEKADSAITRSDPRTAVFTIRPLRITGKHKPMTK